jgi:molecular chaperone Hsp33
MQTVSKMGLSKLTKLSPVHPFIFEGLPVRGFLVQMHETWTEILSRRRLNPETGEYPKPVRDLLGEMTAAAVLLQSNIRFDGALILQIWGDGPVKVAMVEVQPDLRVRATAKVVGEISDNARLSQLINLHHQGRCSITYDPQNRQPGQQPYQGVVPLERDNGLSYERFSEILEQYMRRSEQLDTTIVLAADDVCCAGILIQRMPIKGRDNLGGEQLVAEQDAMDLNEDYNRISILTNSVTTKELLTLKSEEILHRLFWEERVTHLTPKEDSGAAATLAPYFGCTCSRARVGSMIQGLGLEEAQSILDERERIDVSCDFCGANYLFDAVDTAQLFNHQVLQPPAPDVLQ